MEICLDGPSKVFSCSTLCLQSGHIRPIRTKRGWEEFTDAVVSWLNQNANGLVFLLWGSYAQKKGSAIDRKRHHVLQTAHPSPLSVCRGFFGCRHFSRTNELLQKSGKQPINWKDL